MTSKLYPQSKDETGATGSHLIRSLKYCRGSRCDVVVTSKRSSELPRRPSLSALLASTPQCESSSDERWSKTIDPVKLLKENESAGGEKTATRFSSSFLSPTVSLAGERQPAYEVRQTRGR
jgi:hypothetical protein